MDKRCQQGYIAMITAIILGMALLASILSFALLIFFNRQGATNALKKENSFFAARACLEEALLKITVDPDYLGGEAFSIDGDQCNIGSVELVSSTWTIRASSSVDRSLTTLKLVVDNNLETVSFEEE